MNVLRNFVRDIDHAQGEHALLDVIGFRKISILNKMSREINVRSELSGEFEGVDSAVQHRISPVKNNFAEFHASFRNSAPVRAVIVKTVRQLYPFQFLRFFQCLPKFVHVTPFLSETMRNIA